MTRLLFLAALLVGATTAACQTPQADADNLTPNSGQAHPETAQVAFEVTGMKKTKSGAT